MIIGSQYDFGSILAQTNSSLPPWDITAIVKICVIGFHSGLILMAVTGIPLELTSIKNSSVYLSVSFGHGKEISERIAEKAGDEAMRILLNCRSDITPMEYVKQHKVAASDTSPTKKDGELINSPESYLPLLNDES